MEARREIRFWNASREKERVWVRELEELEDILGILDLKLNFESGFVFVLVAICGGGDDGDGDVFWEEGTRGGGGMLFINVYRTRV